MINRVKLTNELGILTEADKEYLLKNVADSEQKVAAAWNSALQIKFDKKRIIYVSKMVSIISGAFVWNVSIRMQKRFDIKLKRFNLWQKSEVMACQNLMLKYYSEVGQNIEPVFLSYDTSLHYNKPLTDEETGLVNQYFAELKNNGLVE